MRSKIASIARSTNMRKATLRHEFDDELREAARVGLLEDLLILCLLMVVVEVVVGSGEGVDVFRVLQVFPLLLEEEGKGCY